MKKLTAFLLFIGLFVFANTASSQTKVVANGNVLTASKIAGTGDSAKATQYTFIDSKGVKYPVFISTRGKYYYNRTAKTSGNVYKVYITIDSGSK